MKIIEKTFLETLVYNTNSVLPSKRKRLINYSLNSAPGHRSFGCVYELSFSRLHMEDK